MVLASVLVVLAVSTAASAQCRVEGDVRAEGGLPLAGVVVKIISPDLRAPLTATTDAAGHYAIDNVKPGTWVQVMALHPNGRVLARTFSLISVALETINLQALRESSSVATSDDLDPQGGPSAEVRGVVTAADGSRLAGARVSVANTPLVTVTDGAGRYAMPGLRAGMGLELSVAADGYDSARAQAVVPAAGHADVNVSLDRTQDADAAPRDVQARETGGATDGVPGLAPVLGRPDLFRSLQFLPSASAALEASSELVVRGGTPDQTGVMLDGFRIYPIPHPYGTFTGVNGDAVQEAALDPDNTSAADSGYLAGALRLVGASGANARPGGALDVSMLGVAANVATPLGSRGSLLIAGRQSPRSGLYGDVRDYIYDTDTEAARARQPRFSGGAFDPLATSPSFYDLNGKAQVRATGRDRVSFTFYNARDVENASRDSAALPGSSIGIPTDPSLPDDATLQLNRVETWRGRGASAQWERRWMSSATTEVSVGRSEFSSDAGTASILTSASTGTDYSYLGGRRGSQATAEQNAIRDTTLRVVNAIGIGFDHALTAGIEVGTIDADYSASTELFDAGGATGRPSSSLTDLLHRSDQARITTFFGQDAWRPMARLTVTPGVRVAHSDLSGKSYVDPRLTATYLVNPLLRVTGGYTIDHQLANRIVREDLAHGDSAFWTLADGHVVAVPRAGSAFAGATVELPQVVWTIQAFYKTLDDLTTFAPRLLPGAAADATAIGWQTGSGRASGVETLLRHTTERNTLQSSLKFGRTEYTYPTLQTAAFPASFDRAAELKVADQLRFRRAWSAGATWVLASGRPVTPVTGAEAVWFPSGDSLYRIAFGDKNSSQLPAYHRLDITGQRDFQLGRLKAAVGATVFNVYDRQNIDFTDYDLVDGAVTSSNVLLMRRSVNVFMRARF